MRCSLGISNFLEVISSLSHSVVFLYFFALITGEDFLISPCYLSLPFIGYIFPFLICLWVLFFSQLFVRPPQTAILPFCLFFLGMDLIPASSIMLSTSIHASSGTLSIRSKPLIYFSLPLYNHKGFDLGHA